MLKNILTVLRGTVVGQIIGFLALPILSRLYSPTDFGDFQLYQSILVLMLMTAALRYEVALLRADDGSEMAHTLQLCLAINLVTASAAAFVCWGIASFPGLASPGVLRVIWFLPVALLFGGFAQTFSYLLTRQKAFRLGANAKIAQVGGYVASGIGLGIAAPGVPGLLLGDLTGKMCSVLAVVLGRRGDYATVTRRPPSGALGRVARKFRDYPLMSLPGSLINSAGGVMTSFMMYATFDAAVSGQYGLTERSIMLPIGMVAIAVSQVFTADLATSVRAGGGDAQLIFRGVVKKMLLLSTGPALVVALFAPGLFEVLFGQAWRQAGDFARMMAPLLMVSLVMGSVNMALLVLGWQRLQLAWEIGRLALLSLTWLGISRFNLGPDQAIALHVAANVIANLVYVWIADRKIQTKARSASTVQLGNQPIGPNP
jgi:O-antigen/teichoic acid export membrane protein